MSQFKDQVFAITGAGSGIGRSLAIQFAERGAALSLSDLNMESLEETRSLLPQATNCLLHEVDVSDREAMRKYATATVDHFGSLNGIINNAGVTLVSRAMDTKRSDFEWLMNINFWGVVNGVEAFLPYIRESNHGYVVNISSLFGLVGLPLQSTYNASKFAVRGYTEALKMEMAGTKVQVACVHPGGIATNIANSSRVDERALPGGRSKLADNFEALAITTADQAATSIIQGLEKKRRRILIGKDAKVVDWFARHFPGSYEKWLKLEKGVLSSRAKG